MIKIHKKDLPTGTNTPIFTYCRQLIKEGVNPSESLEVWGPSIPNPSVDILHMKVNVGNGASLTVDETSSPVFKKYSAPLHLRCPKLQEGSPQDKTL